MFDKAIALKVSKDQIIKKLQDRIIHWEYFPNYHLKEGVLSKEFGISRLPIREVLSVLEAKGFVYKIKGKGFFVKLYTEKEVRDIYHVRSLFEKAAVENIIAHIDEYTPFLEKSMEHWRHFIKNNIILHNHQAVQEDSDFHVSMIRCMNNQYLYSIYNDINERITVFRMLDFENAQSWVDTCTQHLEIIRLCLEQNVKEAIVAINANIDSALSRVEEIFKKIIYSSLNNQKEVYYE